MARRFGKFNPNQKRDKNGKWTSGGGSSSKKSKPRAGKRKSTKSERKRVRGGALIGGTVGFFGSLGNPAAAVAGAAIGAGIAARGNRKARKARKK